MIAHTRDSQYGAQRQGPVRTGQCMLVKGNAAGSGFALEELAIPGRNAKFIPVMVVDGDPGGRDMIGGGSRPGAGYAYKNGQNCAGKGEPSARTFRVIGSSDSVHVPPLEIVEIRLS